MNDSTWARQSVVRDLDRVEEFTDPGERAALDWVRSQIAGRPILDVGVGAGRTIPLLTDLTTDYRAVDFSPVMVETSRARFPDVRVDIGDARNLEGCPSGHFGLVNFSFAGIDSVPVADRPSVFGAARRVLAPGGFFLFSTLNLEGPSFRERPWRVRIWSTRNPIRIVWRVAVQLAGAPLDLRNWLRIRQAGQRGPGFAVAPLSAHHYTVLAHYTTLEHQLEELAQNGFDRGCPVFESRAGERVQPGDDTSRSDWFHFVASLKRD